MSEDIKINMRKFQGFGRNTKRVVKLPTKAPGKVNTITDPAQEKKEMKSAAYDKPGVRDGTGPFRDSYRRRVEKKKKGRRQEAGEECPFPKKKSAAFLLGEKAAVAVLPCPGSKILSKGKGRGLGTGKGKGPIGIPVGEKKIAEEDKSKIVDGQPCPGSKIRSKGKGRGLGIGKGKGPIGIPVGEKKEDKEKSAGQRIMGFRKGSAFELGQQAAQHEVR